MKGFIARITGTALLLLSAFRAFAAGEVTFEITGPRTGPCVRCAVPSWDAGGQRRWKELQTHLIERHDNRFGAIARVTRE